MREVRVDLGAWVGPGRLVRWRLVADEFTIDTTTGWSVDDVVVSGLASGPGRCNLAPLALDDVATTEVDRAVAIDVLANDSDPEGTALVVEAVGAPAHGTAAVAGGVVVYEPAAGYFGEDRFDYEATDGDRSARASVAVHVVTTGAEPDRARGHGEVDDGGSPARFAFHARREEGVASGWLRFRDVEGLVGDLRFPFAGEVEMTGVCWLADGSPCSFRANAAEAAAGARAFFAIELFDGGGSPIDSASGSLATGRVMVD